MLDRASWLEWRRGGLGGSDVAAVLGLSRWSSPWDVWLSKVHGIDGDRDDTQRMTGRLLEGAIGQWAGLEVAKELVAMGHGDLTHTPTAAEAALFLEEGAPVIGPEDWIRGTPDFVLRWLDLTEEGIECKVSEWPYHEPEPAPIYGDALEDLLGRTPLPVDYEIQVRWYMLATGRRRWWLASFARKAPAWNLYRIDRDSLIEDALVEAARTWWTRHVVHGVPPDLDASPACGRALHQLHPRRKGASVAEFRVATEEEIALAHSYQDLDRVWQRLGTEREETRNALRRAIGDAPGIRWTGGTARWSGGGRLTVRTD